MDASRRTFLLCLLFAPAAWAKLPQVVRITNGEWPPYLSKDLPYYGIASRIVTEAFALQAIRVHYGFFPWRRGLALADIDPEWDGTVVWLTNQKRAHHFYLSDPIVHSEIVFFHRKNFPFAWSSIRDLVPYRLGITNDYYYGPGFRAAVKNKVLTQIESVPSDEQNLRKLLFERIDLFPVDNIAGNTLLHDHFSAEESSRLTWHPKPLYAGAMHLMLTRKKIRSQQLMREFNDGLRKLGNSGRLQAYRRAAEMPTWMPDEHP